MVLHCEQQQQPEVDGKVEDAAPAPAPAAGEDAAEKGRAHQSNESNESN